MQSSLDFDHTHNLFADSLDRYLKAHASDISANEGIMSSGIRHGLAEMGVMGLSIPEKMGGSNSPLHLGAAMEVFGRNRLNASELVAGVIGSRLLLASSSDSADVLSRIADGGLRLAFADGHSSDSDTPAITASVDGQSFVIDGQSREVIQGPGPERLLISARQTGGSNGSALLLAVDAADLTDCVEDFRMIDGSPGSRMLFSGTKVAAHGVFTFDTVGAIDDAKAWGVMCLCWEATGAMGRLLDITTAYAKVRKQFGVPIGNFQALQHMMVDMMIHTEQSRDAALLATNHIGCADRIAKRVAVSSAKFQIGRGAKFVRERAVQIHGAIGMTDEIEVTKLFKRLMVIEHTLGSSDHHLEALVEADFERHSESYG